MSARLVPDGSRSEIPVFEVQRYDLNADYWVLVMGLNLSCRNKEIT